MGLIFLPKILLSGCVDDFIKRIKIFVPRAFVEIYKHLRIVTNTRGVLTKPNNALGAFLFLYFPDFTTFMNVLFDIHV